MSNPHYSKLSLESVRAQRSLSWSAEIARRLLEHFEFIKVSPRRIVNLGSGAGWGSEELLKRFPQAHLINVDLSWQMLNTFSTPTSFWQRFKRQKKSTALCANAEALPLQSNSIDIVFCHLLLPVVNAELVLKEIKRVLRPNGLFLFSSFGPDTLREIPNNKKSQSFLKQLVDMHDVGDALVHAGYQHPVMDRENITLNFDNKETLIHDFYSFLGYPLSRIQSLTKNTTWLSALKALPENQEGGVDVTLEINYGHAWKADLPTTADGRPVIPIQVSS